MIIHDPIDRDTVRVRWLCVSPEVAAAHMPRWRGMLDGDERARADRYYFDADREIYTAAHALTRTMLSLATGRPTTSWRYVIRASGKPELGPECAGCGLRFNLSHTREFVVCALAYDEVGIDAEASDRRTNFEIADRFFAPEEARVVRAAPAEYRAHIFFRFWTLKEAFIKVTGEGLRRPLDSFSFTFDPLQIAFHPEREDRPRADDPADWQFFEMCSEPNRPVALAVHRPDQRPSRLDARDARPEDVGPLL